MVAGPGKSSSLVQLQKDPISMKCWSTGWRSSCQGPSHWRVRHAAWGSPCLVQSKNLGWSPPKVLGETNCRIDDLRSFRDNWDFGHMLQRLHMDPALTMVIQWLLNQWWCPKMCWCSCWSPSWWSRCYLQPFGKHLARVGSCSVHRNLVWCFNNPPSQLGSSSQILRISWDIKMI